MLDEKKIIGLALDLISPTVTGCRCIGWDVLQEGDNAKLNIVSFNIIKADDLEEPFTKCFGVVSILFQKGSTLNVIDEIVDDMDKLLFRCGNFLYRNNIALESSKDYKFNRTVDLTELIRNIKFDYTIGDAFKISMNFNENDYLIFDVKQLIDGKEITGISTGLTQSNEQIKFSAESYVLKYLRVYSAFRNIRTELANILGIEQINYSKKEE